MKPTPRRDAVLRCVPAFGSEDTVSPMDVADRLGMSCGSVYAIFSRAHRRGLVVRIRLGAYQLARRAT